MHKWPFVSGNTTKVRLFLYTGMGSDADRCELMTLMFIGGYLM